MAIFVFQNNLVFDFDGNEALAKIRRLEFECLCREIIDCCNRICVRNRLVSLFWEVNDFNKELFIAGVRVSYQSKRTFQTRSPSGLVINFTVSNGVSAYPELYIITATQSRKKS
jgi:hypothetical protein